MRAASTAVAALMATAFAAPVNAAPRPPLDGVWKTDGYGLVLSIGNGRLRSYETTSISCLPGEDALKRLGTDRDGAVRFGADGVPTLTVRAQGRDRPRARYASAVADIDLVRLRALPDRCSRPMPKDPLTTFDVFWTTFAENYPGFAAKKVDWAALRDRYRPKANARTGDERLFEILTGMMKPLGDNHTGLMFCGSAHGLTARNRKQASRTRWTPPCRRVARPGTTVRVVTATVMASSTM